MAPVVDSEDGHVAVEVGDGGRGVVVDNGDGPGDDGFEVAVAGAALSSWAEDEVGVGEGGGVALGIEGGRGPCAAAAGEAEVVFEVVDDETASRPGEVVAVEAAVRSFEVGRFGDVQGERLVPEEALDVGVEAVEVVVPGAEERHAAAQYEAAPFCCFFGRQGQVAPGPPVADADGDGLELRMVAVRVRRVPAVDLRMVQEASLLVALPGVRRQVAVRRRHEAHGASRDVRQDVLFEAPEGHAAIRAERRPAAVAAAPVPEVDLDPALARCCCC
mmetsp:Transcript_4674/g.15470  ORF Transcript_4674/g.15470 Transcript_4674/m.15470 type:complete len:274 (-) Transcript_4674:63-884(-)